MAPSSNHILADIGLCLATRPAVALPPQEGPNSAVALVLRPAPQGPEVLFIERARRAGDPWSGDIGFPGGRVEAADAGPEAAARRETAEELGLALPPQSCLGRLDDIAGAHLPVVVACFVFALETVPRLTPNNEVREAFWVPLADLRDPARRQEATVHFRGKPLRRPAIRLPGEERPVLWGITYRLVEQFLRHLDPGDGNGSRRSELP